MAADLARYLPNPNPLNLRPDQKQIVGEHLAKLLKSRVAYHHSGLSYAVRAGIIEPLAKAGQLRVVVATMGLAAGINFSLRSVALAGESYRRDNIEQPLRPDEILQMFGRAGRRGIDETGYALISANEIRLREGYPAHLYRSGMVDWSALIGLMSVAAEQGRDPFLQAMLTQERLFTTKPVFLGIEESLKNPVTPCGLRTDSERARHVRKRVREILNSRGEWELLPAHSEKPLREIFVMEPIQPPAHSDNIIPLEPARQAENPGEHPLPEPLPNAPIIPDGFTPVLLPALSIPAALQKVGNGILAVLHEHDGRPVYGRSITIAEHLNNDRVLLVKWIRRQIHWTGRQASLQQWNEKALPLIEQKLAAFKTPVVRIETKGFKITALVSIADLTMRVPVDSYGVALWHPIEREVLPADCARCRLVPVCRTLSTSTGVALLWRRLGLVDPQGTPTLRGKIVSYFSQGDGLAIAAALEDATYPLDELIYDLANLDAGFRFCGEENRWAGRLPMACHQIFGLQSIPGYLENGVPPRYGSGAEQIVASTHKDPATKFRWVSPVLGIGDIDRIIIEWRSLLRQIAHAPPLEWARWSTLQAMARAILNETESPTLTDLPPLDYTQTRRVDHRLIFRRH